MRLAATVLAARAALRRGRRTVAVLGVLLGLSAGTVATALVGAERVEHAYDRLLSEVDAPDFVASCATGCTGPGSPAERLGADPSVAGVTAVDQLFVALAGPDGEYLGVESSNECYTGAGEMNLIGSDWSFTGRPALRLAEGRFPTPGSLDEVVLADITARRAGVDVGDEVALITADCGTDELTRRYVFPPRELRVVGIATGVLDVRPPGQAVYFETQLVTPELIRSAEGEPQTLLFGYLRPGATASAVSPVTDGFVLDIDEHARVIRDDLRPDATALRLFALVAFVGMVVVLGQLLANAIRSSGGAQHVLGALGARRRDRWAVGVIHGAVIAAAAGAVAGAVVLIGADALSLGSAEPIERSRDLGWPIATAVLAGVATAVAVTLLGVVPAGLAARAADRRARARAGRLPSRTTESLGLPAAPCLGTRFALEPAGGPSPAPIRTGLGALVVSIAAVSGAITFVAGLERLRSTPRLVGWNWDFAVSPPDGDVAALAAAISRRPDVGRAGMGIIYPAPVSFSEDFSEVPVLWGFDAVPGSVEPPAIEGRAPSGPNELLLSPGMADRLGADVGDVVDMYSMSPLYGVAEALHLSWEDVVAIGVPERLTTPFEVVGIGVVPVLDGRLDLGASVTLDGYRRLLPAPSRRQVTDLYAAAPAGVASETAQRWVGDAERYALAVAGPDGALALMRSWTNEQFAPLVPSVEAQGVFVDVADGHDWQQVLDDLIATGLVGRTNFMSPLAGDAPANEIVKLDLSDADWIPTAFAVLMAATGAVVLAFTIVSGARTRRQDLATLRALGLAGGQTRAVVRWQAAVSASVGIAVGVPSGVVAGRLLWIRYARGLQVVPEAVTPWGPLALVVTLTLAVSLIVAIVPGWRESRHPPVESLHAE